MSRLLVVEGTCGVGKSTLLGALLRRHVAEGRRGSLLSLTQAHTYGPLAAAEDDGTLTRARCLAHLDAVLRLVEWPIGAVAGRAEPRCHVLVDTLHLTQCSRPGLLRLEDVAPIDERLARLGGMLFVLVARPDTLWERCIVARRGSGFLRYARRFGGTEAAIHAHFLREQERLVAWSSRSAMRRVVLDAEDPGLRDLAWALWAPGR